jgi:uncharacterized membrane protein
VPLHAGHLVSIAFVLAASFISASQVAAIRPTPCSPWNFREYILFGDPAALPDAERQMV